MFFESVWSRFFGRDKPPGIWVPARSLYVLALILLCAYIASFAKASPQSIDATPLAAPRPNILVFVTDDHRADGTLDVMPQTRAWFGQGGTRFPNAFATTTLCCPGRASIFTGR